MPRALWAADEGLRQEQALQIVAVHDAGCVLGALSKVEAQRTMAAALLDWGKQATPNTEVFYLPSDDDDHVAYCHQPAQRAAARAKQAAQCECRANKAKERG